MNSEFRYILKGVFYTVLLIGAIYSLYYAFSNKKQDTVKEQPPVITHDDLMNTPEIAEGKALFKKNCSACHYITGTDEMFFGKIADNDYDKKSLYAWVRNGDSVLASGNVYYNNLSKEYNNVKMFSFPDLSDQQLDEIMSYIKVEKTFQHLPKQ